MKNNYISQLHFISKHSFILLILLWATYGIDSNAAITKVGATNSIYGENAQTITVNIPAGATIGDVLIINTIYGGGGATLIPEIQSDPASWTVISSGLSGDNTFRGTVFYKVITNTWETSFTIVLSYWPIPSYSAVSIVAFRGVDPYNPIDAIGNLTSTSGTTGTTINPNGITTVTPNALVMMLGMNYRSDSNNATRSFNDNSWRATSPSTFTELYDYAGTRKVRLGAATALKTTPGFTGNGAITLSGNNTYRGGIILALRPAPCSGYWTGATSNDWNDTRNWCDGAIPTSDTNVTIPASATNQPVIGTEGGVCNNITIGTGAALTTDGISSLTVSGNFTNNGSFTTNNGSVIFNGNSPQLITGSTATTFYDLTVQNTGTTGNNTLTLNQPTTVTGTVLLITGNIITNSTNLLSITNTTNSGIMGGSVNSYISGPVKWTIPNNFSSPTAYIFPVGDTFYLPFTVINPTTNNSSTPTLQVQAFNQSSGGNKGTLTSISTTEYWSLTTPSSILTASISLGNSQSTYPYNVIAGSSTKSGTYSNLGGTSGFYDITNSNVIGVSRFFILADNGSPQINVVPPLLGGFAYTANFGPSTEQTFTVNGSALSAGITINAPTHFEISLNSGTGFQSSITLPANAGKVASTFIYIRLKAGLIVGTYPSEDINLISGAVTAKVTCNGTVFSTTPGITTSGGRLCPPANQINLYSSSDNITALYWTGPNGFYSISQNPIITPTTAAMNGTYTVTGSIPVGANAVVNGDFESGNTGFTSNYKPATDLVPEGNYAVTSDPKTYHSGYSSFSDHTKGGTTPNGNQMVINGATSANATVWSQTIRVTPNSNYQFSYWLQSVVNSNASQLQTFANGQPLGAIFTASLPNPFVRNWTRYYYNWYSGSNTSVVMDIRNQNTAAGGNDFSLDDIDLRVVQQVTSSVDVTALPAAAVKITASTDTSIISGTNVEFSAMPANGGNNPTYVWKVTNGTTTTPYPATSNSKFSYTPVNGDIISCVMTSSADMTCITDNHATSNSISFTTTTIGANYWLGAIGTGGTAWNDPNNWTANKVPASGDNVEFATTDNNAGVAAKNDLYVDYNRIVGSIINNASGKNLVIPADKEVVVNNQITLIPVNTSSTYDQIQVKCDPNPTDASRLPNGSIIFPNAENVNATVEMYCKANIVAGATNENDRYFWQYFGIPITTVTADPTLYGAYVRRAYEPGTDDDPYYWTELTNADPINKFVGHEICQTNPTVYTFKGELINTDFNSGLLAYTSTAKYPGQHLFANSYTAAIDIKKIELGSDMEQSIFLYNTGSYGQWNNNNGVNTNGSLPGQYISIPLATAGSNNVPGEVPSMSSMLVKTGANGSAQSYMKFKYKDVIIKNSTIQRVKSADAISNTDLVSTMIDLTGLHYSDRMWIFTEPSCTRNFDNGWDGRKILGSSLAPQIYAIEPDGDYQVNSVSDMHDTDLAFQAGDEVEYTLKFTHENIQRQYAGVYLVDLIENKTVDVSQNGSTYTFATAQTNAPAKRFKILTRPYENGAPDKETQVKIFTAPGRVFVQNLSTFKGECTLYDIAGRAIKNTSFAANTVTEVLNNLTPGAYVVNTITNGEKLSKRVIVQ